MKLSGMDTLKVAPKSWVGFSAAVLGLVLASSSLAHQPEGVVYPVLQWPEGQEPIIDGDLWEWDWIPGEYRISSSICRDANGDSPEAYGLESEIIVGWSESQNRIYILEVRQDDDFILGDPDTYGDAMDIQLDGDHGGELIYFSRDEFGYTEEEQRRNNGRWAQSYQLPLPGSIRGPEDTWAWFWVSESTWYDQPEYMDMAYVFEGQPGGEGWLVTESSWTLWDDFNWNDPDASVQTDLEEGRIIGVGWMYLDGNDENDLHWFYCSGPETWNQWGNSGLISDFLLEPLNKNEPYIIDLCPCKEVDDDSAVIWKSWRRFKGPSDAVISLSFSPDGHTLATASVADSTVRLWDVSTGTLQATLEGHTGVITEVAYSPDGHTLASGSRDGTIRLWDLRTDHNQTQTRHTLRYEDSIIDNWTGVSSLAYSPDGGTLASGHYDGTLWLWDVGTGQLVTRHGIMNIFCGSLAYSPDGTMLACGSFGGGLRLWKSQEILNLQSTSEVPFSELTSSPDGSAPKRTESPPIPSGVGTVAFTPDGSKLAWGLPFGGPGTRLWDLDSDQIITLREGGYVAFSPDGHTLAIGHVDIEGVRDWMIRLWDAETGQHKATLEGHTDDVTSVAFSPDGTLASTSASDDGILFWDMSPFITDPPTVVSAVEPAVPAASGLDAIAPNPFNTTTRISYRMGTPGPVRLEIYNTLGQRVRTLVDEAQPAGSHHVLWDARDQEGAVVSAGVYLARLHNPGGGETRRLLYLK